MGTQPLTIPGGKAPGPGGAAHPEPEPRSSAPKGGEARAGAAAPSGDGASAASRASARLIRSGGVGKAKVLVVEDSRTQADWLEQVLSREGHEVILAGDGREAERRIVADKPDLVLLDLILPDREGLEVLRFIKTARAEESFTPVILLSVKSDLDSRVKGLNRGADDFIAKPFADAEILARVAAMLRIKALQDELRFAKSQLEQLSITDGLTGLCNHRHFQERLRVEVQRAQRYSDPVSLIMLDLDHFKDVNDRYGHPFGDRVLRETAELIRKSIRDPDICARYGGEEFTVILPKTPVSGALGSRT